MPIIDLTLDFEHGMRGVDIEAKSTVARDGWNSSTYHLYSHSGTHMDAPLHFGCTDQTIDKIPLERCIGVAWVADLTHLPPRSIITVGDLGEPAEKFEPGHSIILRTGWSKYVKDPDYYRNELHRIGPELAEWCVDRRVNMLAVEAPSVADVNNREELTSIHRILLSGDVIIVEGLANLDRIHQEQILFAALPLRIKNGDGSPCRAFAATDPAPASVARLAYDRFSRFLEQRTRPTVLPVSVLKTLPPVREENSLARIRRLLEELNLTVVVMDDDPTGTQTVYNIPVITDWSSHQLEQAVKGKEPLIYILTNSRSLSAPQAEDLTAKIGRKLKELSSRLERRLLVVSRSDSTLRGHFPLEVNVLASELGLENYALVLAPFFREGGRVTIDDIHYVQEGDELIPAADTPFAADKVFGYRQSNLRNWVEEKTKGRVVASSVRSVGIKDIREGGVETVKKILEPLGPENPVVLNAAELSDIDVSVLAILELVGNGKEFVFRTAASFVQSLAGLESRPPLEAESLNLSSKRGGLVLVGSYVPKTTAQIDRLLESDSLVRMELKVEKLLNRSLRGNLSAEVIERMNRSILAGQSIVLYTSRELITGSTHAENLKIGREVSAALVEIVRGLEVSPRFIIAKGGVTANDIATRALNVQCATVLGQLLPGIPVWRLEAESRFPQVPYVVFPGNVGDEDALLEACRKLTE